MGPLDVFPVCKATTVLLLYLPPTEDTAPTYKLVVLGSFKIRSSPYSCLPISRCLWCSLREHAKMEKSVCLSASHEGALVKQRYACSCTHSQPRHWMEVNCQPHSPTALPPEKGHSVSTEQEAGLFPERVSSFVENYQSLSPFAHQTPQSLCLLRSI